MSKKVLVFLADGLEEIEAITSIDILRRAELDVTTVTLAEKTVHGSHEIDILADSKIDNLLIAEYEGVVLPGGMPGSTNLRDDERVIDIVQKLYKKDKIVAAICAAPLVLDRAGILKDHKFTIHPGVEDQIQQESSKERTVVDNNVITGIASGAAAEFAFKIVENLVGKDKVDEINKGVYAKL
ncbi:MAG: DJ-1/PfpI family protein [Candidatus Marinimicrobia bacterium]|nr:DJ-1/PfpI family protein [Candidatus Neomarinimicrobiota bacterium]